MKEPVVVALKTATDKASLEDLVYQAMHIAAYCLENDLNPVGCVLTYRGCDDIIKQLKRIDRKNRFEAVLIYSPHQIAKSIGEYKGFVQMCRNIYKSDVRYLRA